jgi:pyruvate/2-oxoglutarate dehydrogenase complex dihydrolipoamide dehydrogenase (E3) component
MPPVLQGLPKPHVIHSGEFGSFAWAKSKHIVIVGGGQSALGLAALMKEIGAHVRVLVRDKAVTWTEKPQPARGVVSKLLTPDAGLGPGWRSYIFSEFPFIFRMMDRERRKHINHTSWGPSGAWWLRDRVEDEDILLNTEIRHAEIEDGRVTLAVATGNTASCMTADHVVVATGFKVDMRQHPFLSQEIMGSLSVIGGAPELTHDFETSVRGLYVIGPASAPNFGPAMRFIYGAKYAVPRVTRHIVRRAAETAGRRKFGTSTVGRSAQAEGKDGEELPQTGVFQPPQK